MEIDRRKLFHFAAEEILRLAQQGNVLIKGWGAATLLRDVPHVIGVRVCAPMDFRVRVLMERQGRKDAGRVREEIGRFDAARDRSLRAYFDVEEEDARLYHIELNTERLSVDACVNAVCRLADGPRFRDTFKSRSALANKLLEAKISSALVEHISVAMAPLGLSVSVADGKVTLAGTTCSGSTLAASVEIERSERDRERRSQGGRHQPARRNFPDGGVGRVRRLGVQRGDERRGIDHPVFAHAVRSIKPRLYLEIISKARIRDLDHEKRIAAPEARRLDG
jgi:Cytidylate kinase-like family